MQKYTELIRKLLLNEGTCYLPNIGILKLLYQPALEDLENDQILPPGEQVILEPHEDVTSSALIFQIASHSNQSEEKALENWNSDLQKLKEQASKEHAIIISPFGQLQWKDQGQWEWKENPVMDVFYQPIAFTFKQHKPEPEVIVPYEEENRNNRNLIFIIIGIVVVLAVGYLAYRFVMSPPENEITSDEATTPATGTPPPLSATPSSDSTELRKAPERETTVASSDSIHYAIIFRVFHSKGNAEHHYKRMRNWGHHVNLYTKDSATYRMGYPFYSLPADTSKNLKKIAKIYGVQPFIIYTDK